jgi:hypothetical protein
MYVGLFEHGRAVIYRRGVLQRAELMGQDAWFGRTGWSVQVHSAGFRLCIGLPGSSEFAECELFFLVRHVVEECVGEGFSDLVDSLFVVGHLKR